MLQEKLNACRVLISEVSQNRQVDQENQNIARKNNTFFDCYNNYFVPTIKSYIVSRRYDHANFSDNVMEDIQKCIEYSKRTFNQKTVVNPVKYQERVKRLSERIGREWTEQTEQYLSGIREELGILKLVSNNKSEIQKILISMNTFSRWPIDDSAMIQYEAARKKADEILSHMEFDDEISAFLKKVKDKEATLLDLSDEIIAWIRREELAGNIMLSIKNRVSF